MGDFPRHWCGREDGYNVVMPMSVLDCDQTACKRLAGWADRATCYDMEHIENMIAEAKGIIRKGQERLARWELAREAKSRATGLT